jgi:uncharacterized protein
LACNNTDHLNVTAYAYASSKIPQNTDGYKIVQLSDFHNHSLYYDGESLLDKIDESEPDAVVCTGDMIDSHTGMRDFTALETMFSHFQNKGYPVYFVSGNHEAIAPYRIRFSFYDILSDNGVVNLEGKRITLAPGLTLSGVRDPAWTSSDFLIFRNEGDVPTQLTALDEGMDGQNVNVLLSHRPELFDLYQEHQYDVTFSGHTHGGQINFLSSIAVANQFPAKYVAGRYDENASTLIISRGLGYSHYVPYRYGCDAEITVTTFARV